MEYLFLILFTIFYFTEYEVKKDVYIFLLHSYYSFQNTIYKYRNNFIQKYLLTESADDIKNYLENLPQQELKFPIIEVKYENKYLVEFKNLKNYYEFDEIEQEKILENIPEIKKQIHKTHINKISQINQKFKNESLAENLKQTFIEELNNLHKKIATPETEEEILKMSTQIVIDKRLEKLKNCFVMEHTPLGNVLMVYDHTRSTFKYYSDNAIPYRYLETVARKYVKQFLCRPIFVDMEEELQNADEKWVREQKEKDKNEEENKNKKEEAIKNKTLFQEKKNVFTKFKSYNKDAVSGKVNTAPPPKNSISNKMTASSNTIPNNNKDTNNKLILKENANRYTYEGKIVNFNFLQKIDKKIVDKKYKLSFADFKKMINK